MRAAPAVSVRCSGGQPWRAVQAVLPALASGAVGSWALLHLRAPAWPAAALMLFVAVLAWRRASPRQTLLAWDGQRWTADGVAGEPAVMIDVGAGMLLRLRPAPPAAPRWIAVTAAEAGPAWHGLRCVAFAQPRPGETAEAARQAAE